jgi:hypothetical protein
VPDAGPTSHAAVAERDDPPRRAVAAFPVGSVEAVTYDRDRVSTRAFAVFGQLVAG